MPESFKVDLNVDGHVLPQTAFTYGHDYNRENRWIDGWGFSIELPAVMRLLDLVTAGEVTAERAQAVLGRIAQAYEQQVPEEQRPSRCYGDCERCQANRSEVQQHLLEGERRRQRYRDPQRYPFAVSGTTIHTISCHTVPNLPGQWDTAEELDRTVFWFTHRGGMPVLPYEPLTTEELERWRAERTGPQGGRRYRLCKVCDPQVPLF